MKKVVMMACAALLAVSCGGDKKAEIKQMSGFVDGGTSMHVLVVDPIGGDAARQSFALDDATDLKEAYGLLEDVYKRQMFQSPTNRSSLPTATGSPLMPSTQAPSHCVSCGQTRPQIDGSELSRAITSAAPATSPSHKREMKSGICTPTGQAATQRGLRQCRQRDASVRASSRLYP